MTEDELKELYKKYNEQHFGNALPEVEIRLRKHIRIPPWAKRRSQIIQSTMGTTFWSSNRKRIMIVLYKEALFSQQDYQQTLLHEMLHVEQLIKGKEPAHDRAFLAKARKLGLPDELSDET